MTLVPVEELSDSIVRMRESLARVELAASRLARDSVTPIAHQLATGISESVQDIDDEIGAALRVLRVAPKEHADIGECGQLLTDLRERMLPILDAHGVRWPQLEMPSEVILDNCIVVERVALVMLRAGISIAGRGGEIRLSLLRSDDSQQLGMRVGIEPAIRAGDEETPKAGTLIALRALAHRFGGSLELHDEIGSAVQGTYWFARLEGGR